MATMIIRHQVKDYDAWKKSYAEHMKATGVVDEPKFFFLDDGEVFPH